MSEHILAIFDLSGIQSFIFATNKMKEIIGASAVVHDALFAELPRVLGESRDGWKSGPVAFTDADTAKTVYIGGGNALAVFRDEAAYRRAARELSKRIFLRSGGAIRLTSAAVPLKEDESLRDNQKRLMAKLDEEKKTGGSALPAPVLPVVAYDNNNYEALVLTGEGQAMTLSQRAKRDNSDSSRIFADLRPREDVSFGYDFEDARAEYEKNYQAVIHMDGNTMGIRIREFVSGLAQTGMTIWEQLTAMRALSVEISELYRGALRDTLREIEIPQDKNGALMFRPIVVDGDDITVMILAEKALPFISTFMGLLRERRIGAFGGDFCPTAAAGAAFVKFKFPFSIAYALAESCCKNAKAKTVERRGGAEAFLRDPVSSMDYQVCYSNISDALETYRNRFFVFEDCVLLRRPYQFGEGPYSYEDFLSDCAYFNGEMKKGNIARSKLKGLRNAYGSGREAAETYGRYIKAHVKKDGEEEPAKKLSQPFFDGAPREAKYFDYLDIMDIAWKEETE
ncbi:MAG: hypothetical protein IJK98_07865 [Clostridia bacterium]|nr:hypothetical protein [Clostridia bacterium]